MIVSPPWSRPNAARYPLNVPLPVTGPAPIVATVLTPAAGMTLCSVRASADSSGTVSGAGRNGTSVPAGRSFARPGGIRLAASAR
jgi:hypothetical protein